LIPRLEFEAAVKQHKAERHARGFSSWSQTIAMLFRQSGTITPAGAGSIDQTGLYTAPLNISSSTAVTVTTTSQLDPTKSGSAIVTGANLYPGHDQRVTADDDSGFRADTAVYGPGDRNHEYRSELDNQSGKRGQYHGKRPLLRTENGDLVAADDYCDSHERGRFHEVGERDHDIDRDAREQRLQPPPADPDRPQEGGEFRPGRLPGPDLRHLQLPSAGTFDGRSLRARNGGSMIAAVVDGGS
jgi:hypothetical protein